MMYKLLALDLDGTVLTDNHTIHPNVKVAIQEISKKYHVVIVTGRHHTAAYPYYLELGLTAPIICCNGTYIYDYQTNQVLTHNAINKLQALRFIDLAKEHQMKLVMYTSNAMVYSHDNPITYMHTLKEWSLKYPLSQRPKIYQIDDFKALAATEEYIWKFVVEGDSSSIECFKNHPWVNANFNGERSWSNRIDFAAKGNSKGKLLAEYVANLGFQPSQVIAIGDNHNDISMIRYAGLGVAMLNADDTVKSYAQMICKTDNNQDGIAHLTRQKLKDKTMTKPMIQIALDQTNLPAAIDVANNVESYVDVIEIGTILAFAEGMKAVSTLRKNHPDHILVCDMKTTDGGAILARMAFEAGANWITVSAAAHIATIEACKNVADEFDGEIQIEIYGNWTMEDAQAWVDLGVTQAIYHRSRDAELAGVGWTDEDLVKMRALSELGLELSITGGIVPEDLHLFEGIKAKTFIAGRALAGEKGQETAEALKAQINRYWN
ncbi:3-keto-L-gulonate-6-phosphate decarboxylase SgbH [Photobacterium malacitanum]|uniref:3-keto-L-gulonate-6-phosphate decarboxylase SgbH n=2 Tax=Photobacterium malacitanum TaxID=2204294 RepID=A0A1Y6ML77_9GAMM|nr:3-keto-L-gulonate-6-phosphate decarboxylase SgbH [Photobacterium malacitanum]